MTVPHGSPRQSDQPVPSIERRLDLEASPERVWRAISDPAEIARWFGEGAELDLAPGGNGWFTWEKHGRFAVRVEVVEPPERLVWRWARQPEAPIDAGPSTRVEWRLVRRPDGGTRLELTESGFERPEDREDNVDGWRQELGELVAHLDGSR